MGRDRRLQMEAMAAREGRHLSDWLRDVTERALREAMREEVRQMGAEP